MTLIVSSLIAVYFWSGCLLPALKLINELELFKLFVFFLYFMRILSSMMFGVDLISNLVEICARIQT